MSKPYFQDHYRNDFIQRHQDKIAGVLGCYDRLIKGTLSSIGYDRAMETYLRNHDIPLKEY